MDPRLISPTLVNINSYTGLRLIINEDYKKEKISRVTEGELNVYIEDFETFAVNECSDEEDRFDNDEFQQFLTSSQIDQFSLDNLYTQPRSNESFAEEKLKKVLKSLLSSVTYATYTLGNMIGVAYNEIKRYIWPPNWVIVKYACSVKNIPEKLKELDLLSGHGPTNELTQFILPIINSMNESTFQSKHTNFLLALRAALASDAYKAELNKYMLGLPSSEYHPGVPKLLELCRMRFEEGDFYEQLDSLMDDIGIKATDKLSKKDFNIIDNVDPNLKISLFEVMLKKLLGHINVNFDPHLQGNIPYIYSILKMGSNDVNLMRIGTPTIEGFTEKAQIIEEFRGYVLNCVVNHKIHLFISLQNDKIKSVLSGDIGGDEAGRNLTIKGLQKDFPRNFFVVVLAHDSNFYKQVTPEGKIREEQNSKEFIHEFMNELFGNNTGFYFPEAWRKSQTFRNKVEKLLHFVLRTYFEGKDTLTRQEKQDFIQIFYANLSLFLIDYSKANNVNITCKDGIDRAGVVNSLLLKLVMTIEGHVDEEVSQRRHKVLTHSAAFWTKSQAIITKTTGDTSNGRRERLLSADKRMNDTKNFQEKLGVRNIQEFLAAAVA